MVDDHTVVFHLSEPNASLPMTLVTSTAPSSPRATFDDESARTAMNQHSVGTGPFKIKALRDQRYLELPASRTTGRRTSPISTSITFLFMPNNAALLVALRNRAIDFAKLGRPRMPNSSKESVPEHPALAFAGQMPLDLDSDYEPLKDVNVRRAIALAIDKQEILDAALGGYGTVIDTMVAGLQDTWAYRSTSWSIRSRTSSARSS